MKTFFITGGGTGGHVYPAVAIAQELRHRGHQVLMIGRKDSYEERVFQQNDLPFRGVAAVKLLRQWSWKNIQIPFVLAKGVWDCMRWLQKEKPAAVIATGGYVSAPLAFASVVLRVPLFCQEQNSYPGLITRITARFSRAIFLGLEGARRFLPKANLVLTGNPIRQVFFQESSDDFRKKIGILPDAKVLLLYGGSQGSLFLNELMAQLCPQLPDDIAVIWQTGPRWLAKYEHFQRENVYVAAYLKTPWEAFAIADVALSRAGAMTISEMIAAGLPALFVPLPSAAENHQFYNADTLVKEKAAAMLLQSEAKPEVVLQQIMDMFISEKNREMRNQLKKLNLGNSAQKIVDVIEQETHS